jgi:PTH1 family peptidyl-tRNA hydrolase
VQAVDERSARLPGGFRAGQPWLVVGLGNPGAEYETTPHNLGFLVVDEVAARNRIVVRSRESMSLVGRGEMAGSKVWLVKPQTYMNRSGPAVRALLEREQLGPENLLVVHDELALPWTALRIRPDGSSAGHNGVQSVIDSLGTEEFARVRIGVDPGHPLDDSTEYLLSPMKRSRYEELDELLEYSARAVESIIAEGVAQSMTKFNRRARGLNLEER